MQMTQMGPPANQSIPVLMSMPATEQNDGSLNSSVDSAGQMQNEVKRSADLLSPISLVYNIAVKRNLNVTFEVLNEKGPPHMKVFVTQCRVGNFVADGEGYGKKISKKRAAEKMLEELFKLPPLPADKDIAQLKRKRVPIKMKTRNLIKVNVDNSENVEEINPIAQLVQIQQANREREPVYTVLEERGAPRRREFVIKASVNGHSCTGVGPNKKTAKRNAAEALLVELGHSTNTSNKKQCCPKTDKTTTNGSSNIQTTNPIPSKPTVMPSYSGHLGWHGAPSRRRRQATRVTRWE